MNPELFQSALSTSFAGGFHCLHKLKFQTSEAAYQASGGACRPASQGPFPADDCGNQCTIGTLEQLYGEKMLPLSLRLFVCFLFVCLLVGLFVCWLVGWPDQTLLKTDNDLHLLSTLDVLAR